MRRIAAVLFLAMFPCAAGAAFSPRVTPAEAIVPVGETITLQGGINGFIGFNPLPFHIPVGSDAPLVADISGSIDHPWEPNEGRITVRGLAPGVAYAITTAGGLQQLATVTVIACPDIPLVSTTPNAPVIVGRGQPVKLSVAVSGLTVRPFIDWFAGAAGDTTHPITGSNDLALTIAPQAVGTYRYWARITGYCSEVAAEFQVEVANPKRRGR
jgi:hypothetical protein